MNEYGGIALNAGKGYAFDRQAGRNVYLDIVKYVAIFLVIWGHVVQQSLAPGVVPVKADGIYRFIYSFHMPLFMGISGYFFGKSIQKVKGPLIYAKKKLKKRVLGLVVPMLAFGLFEIYCYYWLGRAPRMAFYFARSCRYLVSWCSSHQYINCFGNGILL